MNAETDEHQTLGSRPSAGPSRAWHQAPPSDFTGGARFAFGGRRTARCRFVDLPYAGYSPITANTKMMDPRGAMDPTNALSRSARTARRACPAAGDETLRPADALQGMINGALGVVGFADHRGGRA